MDATNESTPDANKLHWSMRGLRAEDIVPMSDAEREVASNVWRKWTMSKDVEWEPLN